MQTFLPLPDFKQSLRCLDMQRLGKQRVEAFQIARALVLPSYGWKNHPAVQMWDGYLVALCTYYNAALEVFAEFGGRNIKLQPLVFDEVPVMPWWFGNDEFHKTHRQALLFKDLEYYREVFPNDLPRRRYKWPVNSTRTFRTTN